MAGKTPLQPFAMDGKFLRVPSITSRQVLDPVCCGCVMRYADCTPEDAGLCEDSRCRYWTGGDLLKAVDFILINPDKLEEYKVAYAAYQLDCEAEKDRPGEPWDFR